MNHSKSSSSSPTKRRRNHSSGYDFSSSPEDMNRNHHHPVSSPKESKNESITGTAAATAAAAAAAALRHRAILPTKLFPSSPVKTSLPLHYQNHRRSPRSMLFRTTSRPFWNCTRPQKWSLASLLILIFIISVLCSLFVLWGVLWFWTTQEIPMMPFYRSFSPRVYFLGDSFIGSATSPTTTTRMMKPLTPDANVSSPTDLTMMYSTRDIESSAFDEWQPIDYESNRCQPLSTWQVMSFPTCNNIHEVPLHAAVLSEEFDLSILGQGWFRTTWRLDAQHESLVLKTLRLEREFKPEYYELHRRDAVAMERLTRSPFVVNVFGMCGNSALNELADFPYPGVQSLEVFNRRLRRHGDLVSVQKIKLRMAASIAVGLADIHSIDGNGRSTLVHYDLNPRNVALFNGGRPKINDFNIAEFLHYDPITNETCGFPARLREPWWRAPEEMTHGTIVNEKVDIYALGNLLFHTLTTHSPRGKMIPSRLEETRNLVQQGIPPVIPPPYHNSTDVTSVAIRKAMELCFAKEPANRASAQEVADVLMSALLSGTNSGPDVDLLSPPQNTESEDEGEDTIEEKG